MRRDPDCAVSNSRSFHRKAGWSVGRSREKKNCCGATPTVLYVVEIEKKKLLQRRGPLHNSGSRTAAHCPQTNVSLRYTAGRVQQRHYFLLPNSSTAVPVSYSSSTAAAVLFFLLPSSLGTRVLLYRFRTAAEYSSSGAIFFATQLARYSSTAVPGGFRTAAVQ